KWDCPTMMFPPSGISRRTDLSSMRTDQNTTCGGFAQADDSSRESRSGATEESARTRSRPEPIAPRRIDQCERIFRQPALSIAEAGCRAVEARSGSVQD